MLSNNYSNDSMVRLWKEEYKEPNDGYSMTFCLNNIRWAYIMEKIAHSKGLSKNIREYVFENINDDELQRSLDKEPEFKIKDVDYKNVDLESPNAYIERMIKSIIKTKGFYIKALTIKGVDSDKNERNGGIDNNSFELLLENFVGSKLKVLSLWNLTIDETKSKMICDALNKRRAKAKKASELEIKLARCNINDEFSFLSNINNQKIHSIGITQCDINDDSFPYLLNALSEIKGLSYVNLSSNNLTIDCIDCFKKKDPNFKEPVRFIFSSNKIGSTAQDREEMNKRRGGVQNVLFG